MLKPMWRIPNGVVQEPTGDDPPVLALDVDQRTEEGAVLVDPAAARLPGSRRDLGDPGHHVDRDQRVGDHRLRADTADRPHRGAFARALRAAHADGRRRHAVRADRAPAVRARHPRLPVGVAIAGRHGRARARYRTAIAWTHEL